VSVDCGVAPVCASLSVKVKVGFPTPAQFFFPMFFPFDLLL